MVKLFCAIVGAAGSAFEVDIDEGASVSALKDAIKAKNPATITCDANDLQLFLAKKDEGRGAWLPDDDQAALDLEDGKIHEDIQALIDGEKMKATKTLQHWLFEKNEMPPPSTDQIHVLVVVPGHVRVDMGETASRALIYKRFRRWIINAQCVVPAILAVITLIVVAYGENPTDEKGCLTVPGRSLFMCQMIGVDIVMGPILSYSQHWKSKLDNMIEEAKDETPLKAQRQEMTDLTFAAEAQHQELTEHTSLLPATEAQRQPQQQQPTQSTKRNRGRGKRK